MEQKYLDKLNRQLYIMSFLKWYAPQATRTLRTPSKEVKPQRQIFRLPSDTTRSSFSHFPGIILVACSYLQKKHPRTFKKQQD